MKDIKKIMITLVALLAVTTGAWAQGPWTSGACTVTFSDGVLTVSGAGAMADYTSNSAPWYGYDIKTIVIESGVTSIGEGAFASCYNLESVSIPASVTSIGARAFEYCGLATTAPTVSFAEGSTPLTIGERAFYYANLKSIDIPNRVTSIGEQAFSGCSSMESVSIPASVTSIREEAFWNCGMLAKVYIFAPSLTTYGDLAFDDNADGRKIYVLSDAVDTYKAGWPAYAADIVGDLQPLASGPKVTWTAASKTGTFTMPGGNVTLEPEYYPQATVADGGVTAAGADARATTDDPLVKVDATKLTGAKKLMYFVSNSGTTAPAYDAEGWTDQLPTAEGFTQQGIVYVWYYPVGTDEGVDGATATYSDGDICATALTVTIGAAPTYAVELAEGTEESDKWTVKAGTDGSFQSLPLKGVKAGTKVKLKYDGDRSMLKGVKAVKKAAAGIVNPVVGQVIGSDGKNYDANATLPDGVTAVAVIAYVGSETGDDTYKNGLAIALADESNSNWSTAKSTCEGKSAVSGAAWLLPSQKQWKTMFKANGGNEGSYSGLNTAIGTAGGTALQVNERYWSSSELDADFAWVLVLGENSAGWDGAPEDLGHQVRACLAF